MKFDFYFNDEEMNELHIPLLKGKDMPEWYDSDTIDCLESDEYYYELYLVADENGKFDHAEIQKVGGASCDDAHGSCYYDELDEQEQEDAVEFIVGLFNSKTWTASAKLYGDGETLYYDVTFNIDDELANKIDECVKEGKLLSESDFYNQLYEMAEEELWRELREDAKDYCEGEKPDEDDYDDEEEYEEALEEYNQMLEDYAEENYSLEELKVYDPSIEKNFKKSLIGKKLKDYDNKKDDVVELVFDTDWPDYQNHHLKIKVDENDIILDIIDAYAEGLSSEDVKGTSYDSCAFNYDFVLEFLKDYLEE